MLSGQFAGLEKSLSPASGPVPLTMTRLGGQSIVTASRATLVEAMLADHVVARIMGSQHRPKLVFDANGQGLSLYARNTDYRTAMDQADIIHADGGFLVTLSRWIGTGGRIAERSATTDMIHEFAAAAAAHGLSFYLLGGPEEINARATETLRQSYPKLNIVGRHHGFFDDAEPVIADIAAAKPDLLWVGLGKPYEQQFAVEIASRVDPTWILTCGGCFNFVCGDYKRAPQWMQRMNIEWLYRMMSSPSNLFWRYMVTNPHAVWLVFADHLRLLRHARR